MLIDATYHRAFLLDGPFEPATCPTPATLKKRQNGSLLADFEPRLVWPPKTPNAHHSFPAVQSVAGVKPRLHYRRQMLRPEILFAGGSIRATFIVDKLDQQFAHHAVKVTVNDLSGGDGDDVLIGGLGLDILDGGPGDNILIP